MVFVNDLNYLVSTGISDLIIWNVEKQKIIKQIQFPNKYNYFTFHEDSKTLKILQNIQH